MNATCAHKLDTGAPCWKAPVAYGYCATHVVNAPEERAAMTTLQSAVRRARQEMDDMGESILTAHVVALSPERVPEDLCRDYRALRHRYNYLAAVLRDRTPGTPLPAEVTMRTETY